MVDPDSETRLQWAMKTEQDGGNTELDEKAN